MPRGASAGLGASISRAEAATLVAAGAVAASTSEFAVFRPPAAAPRSHGHVHVRRQEHSVHDARGSIRRLVPADEWAHLPARFRRLLLRDALLTEPSPGVPGSGGTAAAGRRVGGAMDAGAGGGERQRSFQWGRRLRPTDRVSASQWRAAGTQWLGRRLGFVWRLGRRVGRLGRQLGRLGRRLGGSGGSGGGSGGDSGS